VSRLTVSAVGDFLTAAHVVLNSGYSASTRSAISAAIIGAPPLPFISITAPRRSRGRAGPRPKRDNRTVRGGGYSTVPKFQQAPRSQRESPRARQARRSRYVHQTVLNAAAALARNPRRGKG
jgi:hypothetical protein